MDFAGQKANVTILKGRRMYKKHEAFKTPENENIKIWRYMDFTKFLSILINKELYFRRSDMLDDPFEGSLTQINVKARNEFLKNFWEKMISEEELKELSQRELKRNKELRKSVFVNCWHMSKHESAAMWKLYLKSNEGIVLQSTYKKLKKSFGANSCSTVFIGEVNYIDYDSKPIARTNLLNPFLHKRESFKYEKELRVVLWDLDTFKKVMGPSEVSVENGKYVKVDLDVLIDKVYTSPKTPDWIHELVKSVAKSYGLQEDVRPSSLDNSPCF